MRQRRSLLAIVAAVTMSLALGLPVAADLNLPIGGSATVAWTNGDGINVRTEPGFGGGIVATLPEGAPVTIHDGPVMLDDGTGWFYVSTDAFNEWIEGWVVADYLSGDPNAASTETGDGPGPTANTVLTATVVNTDGNGLRLRDGAALDAGVMTVMPEGATVQVLAIDVIDANGYSWTQVSFDGTSGYAATEYLSIGSDGGTAISNPQPPAEQPSTDPPAETPAAGSLTIGGRAAVVNTGGSGLNLRSEGGYYAGVMTVIPEGDIVTVLDGPYWDGEGNGWYQVDYSSKIGWVHGGYLAASDAAPTTDPTLTDNNPDDGEEQPVSEPPAEDPPAAAESGIGAAIVAEALNYVGVPYVWGGTTPSGFDCSGFTYYIFNKVLGTGLSRDMALQVTSGRYVTPDELLPGDLVFQQNTYKWGLSHVGIYIGGGQMVNAQSERTGVVIADIWDSYWGPRYYTARRIVE